MGETGSEGGHKRGSDGEGNKKGDEMGLTTAMSGWVV